MPRPKSSHNHSAPRKNWITSLFHLDNLTSADHIEVALLEFQAALQPGNFDALLDKVLALQSGQVLALVISKIKDDCLLLSWLSEAFPRTLQSLPSSQHYSLLFLLSTFLLSLKGIDVSENHNFVVHLPSLIGCLTRMSFRDTMPRRKFRKTSNAMEMPHQDVEVFRCMKVHPPSSTTERDAMYGDLLHRAKGILQFYVSLLRSHNIAEDVIESFMGPAPPEGLDNEIQDGDIKHHLQLSAYFSEVEGFGKWKLLITTRAEQDLRSTLKRDPKSFALVLDKMRRLSHGLWSEQDRRVPYGVEINVPIYQAQVLHFWLLFQVDCVIADDQQGESQALKLYGLYKHNKLQHAGFWKAIAYHISHRGKVYEQRCTVRGVLEVEVEQYTPISFAIQATQPQISESQNNLTLPPNDAEQVQFLNMFSRIYPFSEGFLQALQDDLPVGFFLHLSPQEKTVVEHPYSCYVIGRSGTGKTLTMLHKMLLVQRAAQEIGPEYRKPRQVFVTKSRLLALKVARDYCNSAKALKLEMSRIHESISDDEFSWMINYDDESLGQHTSNSVPRFSGLEDQDFPYFTSFDDLCQILLEDMRGTPEHQKWQGRPVISIKDFRRNYWPTFTEDIRQGLDPTMVFSEILGVIEGSLATINNATTAPYLKQSDYERLSTRTYPTFAEDRGRVYALFQQYKKLKMERSEYDTADRTHLLLDVLRNIGLRGRKVDYLYVDEVQDNLLIDALLMRSICANSDGLFWAGDTAQSISPGSSFRFNDLKRLLFEIELKRAEAEGLSQHHEPSLFHLAVNYRSHTGIGRCATELVDFVARFWPNTLDIVPSEGGLPGPKPLFLCGWKIDTSLLEQYLFYRGGAIVDFGAEQCILVRNTETQQALRKRMRESAIILTIYQSKGIEFDDVMLYNFFEDSPASLSQWRLMLDGIDHAPTFDAVKHAIICTELKNLYVAITRARRTVWIVDTSIKAEPVQVFWENKDLIVTSVPGPHLESMATPSSPEQLEQKGQELFHQGLYDYAQLCFARAGNDSKAQIAKVYNLKSMADNCVENIHKCQILYQEAAVGFKNLAQGKVGQPREYWRMSGVCFREAKKIAEAVDAFREAELYDIAASVYSEARMHDEALAFIDDYEVYINKDTVNRILENARTDYFRHKQFEKALNTFPQPTSEGHERAIEFIDDKLKPDPEDRQWIGIKVELLTHLRRFSAAGDIRKRQGRIFDAITIWMEGYSTNRDCALKASQGVIHSMWNYYKFGTNIAQVNQRSVDRLLTWGDKLKQLDITTRIELAMLIDLVRVLKSPNVHQLWDYAREIRNKGDRGSTFFLISMHHYCQFISKWDINIEGEDLVQRLTIFLEYVEQLLSLPDGDFGSVEKFFGVTAVSQRGGEAVRIPGGTLSSFKFLPQNGIVPKDSFRKQLRRFLSVDILGLARDEDEWCRRVPFLQTRGCMHILTPDLRYSACDLKHTHSSFDQLHWKALACQLQIVSRILKHADLYEQILAERSTNSGLDMTFWCNRLFTTFNPILGCRPLKTGWELTPAQQRKVNDYERVKDARLSFILKELPPSAAKPLKFDIPTIRSAWMLRSIKEASEAIRMDHWGPADMGAFCTYIIRLTVALVISCRDDMHGLQLPKSWITPNSDSKSEVKISQIHYWLWRSQNHGAVAHCMMEALNLTCHMIDMCLTLEHAALFITKLSGVLYILARETEGWQGVRDPLVKLKPWSGPELEHTLNDDTSIKSIAESFFKPAMATFANAFREQGESLKGQDKIIYEKVNFPHWRHFEVHFKPKVPHSARKVSQFNFTCHFYL